MQATSFNQSSGDQLSFWQRPSTLIGFVLVFTAIKCIAALYSDFVRDEAYYTLWSLYPLQMGYYDHPPAVVWFIKLGQLIFGETAFASRFITIISTVICSAAIWRTSSILFKDARIAALSVYWYNVTFGASLGLLVITPDAPSILFWMLAIWSAAELLHSNNDKWWLSFGLFAGLGLQAKYTGLFLGGGILLWLMVYRDNWKWFTSFWLYLGGLIAIIIFSPVIYWNFLNDFSSLKFQLGRSAKTFAAKQPNLIYFPEFILSQFGMSLPWLFVAVCVGTWIYFSRKANRENRALGLLVLTMAPLLLYFMAHTIHSRVQGNWPWPIYPQLAIIGAWASYRLAPKGINAQWLVRSARYWQMSVGAIIACLIYVQAAIVPIKIDVYLPTNQMFGWEEVAKEVQSVAQEKAIKTIGATDYGVTGWLASYGKFGGYDYDVLPISQFIRYGFMDLPTDDMVKWPIFVAFRTSASDAEDTSKWPINIPAKVSFVRRIYRLHPNGEPQDAIDLYEMQRPDNALFPLKIQHNN